MTLDINPPMTVETFEAFLRSPAAKGHEYWELVQGQPIERGNTMEMGVIVMEILMQLAHYSHQHDTGHLGPSIWHHQAGDLYDLRMPKIAYYVDDSRPIEREGFVPIYPDLAVEVKSPDEHEPPISERGQFYLSRGTKRVWLVYPATRIINVMSAGGLQTLTCADVLTGEDILPGFSVPVAGIFQLDPSQSSSIEPKPREDKPHA